MSRRERRSVSLGRYRDRGQRDVSRGPVTVDDAAPEVSTRHNISNYLLTLQRLQASEEENQHLRRENDLLRQRTRSSRLSSASFRADNSNTTLGSSSTSSSTGSGGGSSNNNNNSNNKNNNNNNDSNNGNIYHSTSTIILRDAEDDKIAADVKRNSLLFVGEELPASFTEHAALEAQYKKLQEDFETVKEFLKHLFQHALTMSSTSSTSTNSTSGGSSNDHTLPLKGSKSGRDINTCSPSPSKQLERSLDDIHGQISQLKNSQDQQQIRMEQVQQALDNVLCQSSVRNDVTMRIVRQSDKVKELTRHASFLESQLAVSAAVVRQGEEKSRLTSVIGSDIEHYISTNGKMLKGNSKDDLNKIAERISRAGRHTSTCSYKMAAVSNLVNHVIACVSSGRGFAESRPSADVVDAMSKLERLVGSDWHRLGRMLSLPPDTLEEVGKFTNFDLTSRVEKVVTSWARLNPRGACAEALRQGLDKMERDALLLAEQPLCKEWQQLPPEVSTYVIAHVVDVPSLVTEMCGHGVISADNRNFILGCPQEHRRASRLLQSVVYMGVKALVIWCTALEQLNQAQLAARVRDCLPSNQTSSNHQGHHGHQSHLTLDLNNRPSARQGSKSNNLTTSRQIGRDPVARISASTLNPSSSSSSPSAIPSTPATNTTSYNIKPSPSSSTSTPASSAKPPAPSSSSSSSSAATTTTRGGNKPHGEKPPRKKRSRSLFTRKNKLRDTDPDPYDAGEGPQLTPCDPGFFPIGPQAHCNYYHPGINVNVLASSRDAVTAGDRGRCGRDWDARDVATDAYKGTSGGSSSSGGGGGGGGAFPGSGGCGSSYAGGTDTQPWVRNPHHQAGGRPPSRHININSGADEVAV